MKTIEEVIIKSTKAFKGDNMSDKLRIEHHFDYCMEGLTIDIKQFYHIRISKLLKEQKEAILDIIQNYTPLSRETIEEVRNEIENI